MLFNRLYFRLKPFIPRPIRLGVRRRFVQYKRQRVRDVWPILRGSERPPEGWSGWPDGKKFAFVLTHDVESQRGLDRVKELAELEMEFGFRSSFNFIPEGPYSVPAALRSWLVDHGFEVGVHDLNHDGRLFSSRECFRLKAQRINHYLREWGAAGFRSGYMLRNPDWIHDLDIAYDACTFDTDPFEPQPDGAGTIFPFWVPAPRSPLPAPSSQFPAPQPGYVELPYTLPQDSTLFLLLREKTIEIWKKKLDWIVANQGMALPNVHPDYICLGKMDSRSDLYDVSHYRELLGYVHDTYSGRYWHALPRDAASYYSTTKLQGPLSIASTLPIRREVSRNTSHTSSTEPCVIAAGTLLYHQSS